MDWFIAPHTRADLHVFTGINFSGERRVTSIHPAGGRQGATLNNFKIRSLALVGPPGTRIYLCTSVLEEGWEDRPWRAMTVDKKVAYRTKDGKWAVRIPDLDWLDKANAHRTDPDFQQSFPQVGSPDDGSGWTFGRSGAMPIKDNVAAIRVVKG